MHFLASLRYLVFAVFIVCNAILASVAVWNNSSLATRDSRIDIYITVLGALGLFLTFSIIFTELVRRNAFTSRLWFETSWTALFFAMDLAAAAALTAAGPCSHQHKGNMSASSSCSSMRVLLGFAWLCTFILFIYLVLLLVLTFTNRNNESIPKIWQCAIHNLPPLAMPLPQRPTVIPSALYSLRSIGLNSQYEIEHFRPPASVEPPPTPPTPTQLSPVAHPLHRNPSSAGSVQAALALYPRFISSAYVPPSQEPPPERPSDQPPSPLGDWPRVDPPLRVKRKAQTGLLSPTRPIGPRTRSRPPALELNREQENM
ncbi:hypothetical protein C8F01DRAFT_1131909 [Mycena amicta]|nr:hypothetical protein C8F01DRAFT_1131909 [Mycena amicta]